MVDLARLPLLTPETLLGGEPLPPPPGPVRLVFSGGPERERPSMLRECFARMGYRYQIERIPGEAFDADLCLNMLSDLLVMSGTLHGSRNSRSREMVDGDADALLMINLRGPHLIEQRGRQLVLGDGEAVLISGADPSSFTHRPPGEILGLRFPRTRLAPMLRDADASFMRPVPRSSRALHLLTNYLAMTWDERVTESADLKAAMARHIYDLMALLLGSTQDAAEAARSNGLHAARLELIKTDIAENLGQPGLSVTALAARHHCTPRFIQRLFESEGSTLTKYVLGQRLARAYQMLTDGSRATEKISTVAYDCGFNDVSYFNRVFRQHFGAAPSDVRAHARRNGGSAP
ncbi:MAG: helix-turn-helix domain-containing protein [Hyphomicrobiaceae bacterium]|nr:helix-turn-helix domain-containing protein [Hyphomicrobiaceae bacterium]